MIEEQSEEGDQSYRYDKKNYHSLDMKTPAETPNMTFIDVPDTVDSYER